MKACDLLRQRGVGGNGHGTCTLHEAYVWAGVYRWACLVWHGVCLVNATCSTADVLGGTGTGSTACTARWIV